MVGGEGATAHRPVRVLWAERPAYHQNTHIRGGVTPPKLGGRWTKRPRRRGFDWLAGRYVGANQAFQRMTGYSEAELRNLSPVDITHNFRAGIRDGLGSDFKSAPFQLFRQAETIADAGSGLRRGAIESTRLLLLVDRQHDDRL